MQRHDLGDWQVFALTDCAPAAAASAYSFPDANLATHPDAAARWLPDNSFHTRFGVFLLRGVAGDVLVDCGVGPGPHAYFPGLRGGLPAALAAAGSALDLVSTVIFTHLHLDHVGWAGHLPNAKFRVSAAEWAHWSDRGTDAGLPHHVAAFAACVAPLAEAGRLAQVGAISDEITPGISLLPAPGHTPGHHAVLVSERLLIAGDTWHNPAQIEVAAWSHRADHDKEAAAATRARLAAQAERDNWLIAAGHFQADVCLGTIAAGRFRPLTA
jgi:glyoxylase-like metal-dependent hydrolase (beta-lactamase superfamily II)